MTTKSWLWILLLLAAAFLCIGNANGQSPAKDILNTISLTAAPETQPKPEPEPLDSLDGVKFCLCGGGESSTMTFAMGLEEAYQESAGVYWLVFDAVDLENPLQMLWLILRVETDASGTATMYFDILHDKTWETPTLVDLQDYFSDGTMLRYETTAAATVTGKTLHLNEVEPHGTPNGSELSLYFGDVPGSPFNGK